MRFLLPCLLMIACLLAPAAAHANGGITDLKIIQTGPQTTRIVLDATQGSPYRAFVLNNPMRIVIDMPLMSWQAPMNKGDRAGRIKSYRQSVFQGDTRRVVFDLNSPMIITTHQRMPPQQGRAWQYQFDLQTASAVNFQQAINRVMIGGGAPETATKSTGSVQPLQAPGTPAFQRPAGIPAIETSPVLIASTKKEKPLIVLDAGHGGVDVGAIASNGAYEKNITLAVAKRVRDALLATGRYRVHLTRDRDIFIKLPGRVKIARDLSANMFISMHADTIMRPTVQGASVYTLSETASDAETAKLAERENAVDTLVNVDVGDVDADVADILLDLVTRDTMNQSKVLAQTVVNTFGRTGVRMLPQRPHRSAGFAVLKAPDIPSVLIEMGYLSNRNEANLLTTPAHQQKIANSVVAVVDQFFANNN